MLNGVDPIIIFSLKKAFGLSLDTLKIPIVANVTSLINFPLVPLYLSRGLTGVIVDSESKSVEVDTNTETLASGAPPDITQKGLSSTIKIELLAKKDGIGLMVLSALSDIVFEKVTSKEYSITYLHGPIAIFGGLIHSFNVNVEANTDLAKITLEITRGSTKPSAIKIPVVPKTIGQVPL